MAAAKKAARKSARKRSKTAASKRQAAATPAGKGSEHPVNRSAVSEAPSAILDVRPSDRSGR
jgi:hypothetical protein